jgi:K+-transporting ATPase ATPase B chain
MSGVDLGDGRQIRKGAVDAIESYIKGFGGSFPEDLKTAITSISKNGGTPLVVAEHKNVLGVIHLKDIVKGGIKERFAELRRMGIKTIMITGDNPLTAAAMLPKLVWMTFLLRLRPNRSLNLFARCRKEAGLLL